MRPEVHASTGLSCQLVQGTIQHCSHVGRGQIYSEERPHPRDMREKGEARRLYHGTTGFLQGLMPSKPPPPRPPQKPPSALGHEGWRACYINISVRQIAGVPVCLLPPWWQPHKDASDKTKRQPWHAKPLGTRSCPRRCSGPRTPRPAADNTVIVLL